MIDFKNVLIGVIVTVLETIIVFILAYLSEQIAYTCCII